MSTQAIMILTIIVYAAFIAAVAVMSKRSAKNITELTVGGRNAGAWVSALSYGTAYFSAVMFIGYAGGTGWRYGLWGILPGIGNAVIGSFLAWKVLARRTRALTQANGVKSMPDLFATRFDSDAMRLFAAIVITVFLIPYSASVYKGLTSVCSVLLGIDETVCMIVIAAAAILLVTLGGYAATLKADFVQGLIMLLGVATLIFAVVRCDQVGGLEKGLAAISAATAKLQLGAKEHIALWATVLMTSFGTWGLPQMIHKYYAIRDDHEVRRGTVISTLFALVVAGGGYFIGSLSHLFFKELPAGGTDYLVPNMLKEAGLPGVLLGLVLVLLIAASVSTLCSITITASSTFTMDLLGQLRRRNPLSERSAARVMKLAALLFIVISFAVANSKTPILDMMSYSWGVISGSFLAPYALLLYSKSFTRRGAFAGMLGGFLTALPPVVCKLFFPDAALPFFGKVADMGPHFACLAMLVSLAMCVACGNVLQKQQPEHEFYAAAGM
ncbi:MAG: sodium:solute symporter family protein [Oscillospiraceae bacterium]|nr:sodium:solute symporter family protein [Oscillospiraceae bacterium]